MRFWHLSFFLSLSLPGLAAEPLRLDFSRVITLAENRSIEAISADKRMQQAIARIDESRASFYPQLNGTASQFRQTRNLEAMGISLPSEPLIGPFNVFDARLRLTQTLFDKSALERLRLARINRSVSQEEQRKVRLDATVLALTLFVNARRAEEARVAAAAVLERDLKALAIAEQRFQNGSGTSLEVAERSASISVSRQHVAAVETQRVEQRLDLLAMLGLPLDTPIAYAPAPAPTAPTALTSPLLENALLHHASILFSSATVASRRGEESAARADYYPRLEASADYGASGNRLSDSLGTYTYGGQLSLPIFEGGRRSAKNEAARRAREESEARMTDATLHLEARARTAQVMLEQSWTLLQATENDRQVDEKQLKLAETRFRSGLGSDYERLERRTTLLRAEDAHQEALAAYELARIQKAYALGNLETLKDPQP